MLRESSRNLVKQALWLTRVKVIYQRITLTKFTTLFFFLALFNCLVLIALQAVAFADNSEATTIIESLLNKGNITTGLAYVHNDELQYCPNIPQRGNCTVLSSGTNADTRLINFASPIDDVHSRLDITSQLNPAGQIDGIRVDGQILDTTCLNSLIWVADVVRDARREDVIIMLFQVWLFSVSVVAILNESIPHLGTALLAHILATGWGIYSMCDSMKLERQYQNLVVKGTCNGVDLLGKWWEIRTGHTVPIVACDIVALLITSYLTFKLYKVYAADTLRKVESNPKVHKAYKIVLFFSVCLHLGGFFTLVSTGLWIDKVSNGTTRFMAEHLTIYQIAFAIVAALEIPWLFLGWISVRRENRKLFIVYFVISVIIFGVSSAMFASQLYHFLIEIWPFFATLTIASYVLIFFTTMVGVISRLHFGLGLSKCLQASDEDDDGDFAPVTFSPTDIKSQGFANEKGFYEYPSIPVLPKVQAPPTARTSPVRQGRGEVVRSIYSDPTKETVKVSLTPPMAQDSPSSMKPAVLPKLDTSGSSPKRPSELRKKGGPTGLPSNPKPPGLPSNPRPTDNYF